MKIRFENGVKVFIAKDGKEFSSVDKCIDYELEQIHGPGMSKCQHDYYMFVDEHRRNVNIQCNKCGRTEFPVPTEINFYRFLRNIQRDVDIDRNLGVEFYQFMRLMFEDPIMGQYDSIKVQQNTPLIRKVFKWIKLKINPTSSD